MFSLAPVEYELLELPLSELPEPDVEYPIPKGERDVTLPVILLLSLSSKMVQSSHPLFFQWNSFKVFSFPDGIAEPL